MLRFGARFLFLRLLELLGPQRPGAGVVEIGEDKAEDVLVPASRMALNALADVLRQLEPIG